MTDVLATADALIVSRALRDVAAAQGRSHGFGDDPALSIVLDAIESLGIDLKAQPRMWGHEPPSRWRWRSPSWGASPHAVAAEGGDVRPWNVLAERDHAVAVLGDPNRIWTLMVRCTDGHIDEVVAPAIQRYRATLRIDGKPVARLTARDSSMGGYLLLDVASLVPSLEAGTHVAFRFEDGTSIAEADFLAGNTASARQPVRNRCPAGAS